MTGPTGPFTVISVVDTREREERDDRWVPIPGTGDARECDRCGRIHEIHASVVDAAGDSFVVGVGCMGLGAAEARKLSGRAVRAANRAATERSTAAAKARLAEVRAEVAAMTFPANAVTRSLGPGGRVTLAVEDAHVYMIPGTDEAERFSALEHFWRQARMADLVGGTQALRSLAVRAQR